MTGGLAEIRTGRGSAGLVRGEMRDVGRTGPVGKAKGRIKGKRASMDAKEELKAKAHSRSRT